MKTNVNKRVTVVVSSGCSSVWDEELQWIECRYDVQTIDFSLSDTRVPVIGGLRIAAAARKLSKLIGQETGLVIAYGIDADSAAGRALDKAVNSSGGRLLFRSEFAEVPVSSRKQPQTARHTLADREICFLTSSAAELSLGMAVAMAVARPSTHVSLHIAGGLHAGVKSATPSNLSVVEVDTVESALADSSPDWFMAFGVNSVGDTACLSASLSAGVPVLALDSPLTDAVLSYDCALTFGADLTTEEFVRGLLPYIESDYRAGEMAKAAVGHWQRRMSPEAVHSQLELIITEAIC